MTNAAMINGDPEVDVRIRSERAELARLALHVRTLEAEAERAEREANEWREATELVRMEVTEAVQRRRSELEAGLNPARERAREVVAAARAQAALVPQPHAPWPPVEATELPPSHETSMTPEYLAQVVSAAVATSLSHLSGAGQPVELRRAEVVPWRRRLLHLDVVLPLVLVVIIAVVTIAWAT